MASLKEINRAGKFKKLGQAISALKDKNWLDVDYHTGKESEFYIANGDSGNRDTFKIQIRYGPEFKTPQWMRTVPKSK